jgi:hypothetical protein
MNHYPTDSKSHPMTPDHDRRRIESTPDHHAETGSSHSRRGFLKQVATTSLLGLSGVAVATEGVDATQSTAPPETASAMQGTAPTETATAAAVPEPVRLAAGDSARFTAYYAGFLWVEGVADYSNYTLEVGDGTDLYEEGGTVEPGDDLNTVSYGTAHGEIQDRRRGSGGDEAGFYDKYSYVNYVDCSVSSGAVDIYNFD